MSKGRSFGVAWLAAIALAACAGEPSPPIETSFGPSPQLPPPQPQGMIPVMKTARAGAWPAGAAPAAPPGFNVQRFAEGLDHPRWVYVLENGDVLVALSATETKPAKSIMAWVKNRMQRRVGAAQESPDRIVILRDADGDGQAELNQDLLDGLSQPFGLLFLEGRLYVANTDSVVRFPFTPGQTRIAAAGETILTLPNTDGHWTRNVVASPDGGSIFVSVGSMSNIAEKGMDVEAGRALILRARPDGSGAAPFATGLRNPNGMDFEPTTGALWTVVNERDLLGDNLVPDYLTEVHEGAFYGWPWSYWGANVDARVKPANPRMVAQARAPDYALGAHTAALGLVFYDGALFPAPWNGGAYIGLHGSWNRSEFSGYKVIFVPFAEGRPSGDPIDFLTGFLPNEAMTYGRPVGVAVAADGALLVADDVGGIIWRVSPAP